MTRPIVMVELNEVTNVVLDRYIALRPTSGLAHLLGNGWRLTTRLPHEGLLEPWVVWPSIHRGVPVQTHGIVALGQPSEEAESPMASSLGPAHQERQKGRGLQLASRSQIKPR